MLDVTLKKGRERSLQRLHPWVMSGAIARVVGAGDDAAGGWTRVLAADGRVLGYGHYAPDSTIRVRVLSFGTQDPGDALLEQRIERAIARRREHPLLGGTDALRLVNAEGDGLPGLTVDRYADLAVVRMTTAGMQRRRAAVVTALRRHSGLAVGYERADARAARREGLPQTEGVLWGEVSGAPVLIHERGRAYEVDVVHGQKTGFYLDQRDARDLVESLAAGRRVLDLFSYTGGFAVAAARGGARHVTLVDSSQDALEIGERNVRRNAPDCETTSVRADAFEWLRDPAGHTGRFDLLVLDPPPLARHHRDVDRAARACKDLLLHAFSCAAPGAFVLAFSCSHHVGPDLFAKIVFAAALDAGRDVQALRGLEAGADHPVSVHHPEGRYLTGQLLEVSGDGGGAVR